MLLSTLILSLLPLTLAIPAQVQERQMLGDLLGGLLGGSKSQKRGSGGTVSDILNGLLGNPEEHGFGDVGKNATAMSQIQGFMKGVTEGMGLCDAACVTLPIFAKNSQVHYPSTSNYVPTPFWSVQQASLTPQCRIDITTAVDLAATIKTSKLFGCPFAVKSGGHAAFAGASSIQGGILVNLQLLNQVTLSADRSTTSVGPGNTWGDVYAVLDPLGVSVVGGRESGVGVGGLLLGGGISYFSGSLGWACDNVKNYEVVLANGNIVDANRNSNSDLYWALRGGSGVNFGLVSRFDLYTFEQGNLWGGSRFYPMQLNASLATMYSNFVNNAPSDPKAHLYIAFIYAAQLGGFAGITGPAYSDPISNAPIFNELNAIPSLLDATGVMSMGALAVALNQTTYSRETFKAVTFKNDPRLIQAAIEAFVEEAGALLDVAGFLPSFAFQPLSLNIIQNMQKNGGNTLGLSGADGPLTIMNMNWGWSNAADDARVFDAINRFISRCTDLGGMMGLNNRFIYMNYAAQDQDVYGGYGPDSVSRMKQVQSWYDPTGVFKNLQPGYFKL